MPAAGSHPTFVHVRRLHVERRVTPRYPDIQADPELTKAYRAMQVHWMRVVPGYRDEIKAKLNEAAKAADKRAQRIETSQRTEWGERLSVTLKRVAERQDQLERLVGY